MESSDDNTSVRVALRIRPQLPKERIDMCQVCTSVTPGVPQVFLGKDKAFTFDYVYDMENNQQQIYESCANALIEGTFDGYNATIFAYGQTGSGKTYTMGTGFGLGIMEEEIGIVPRAVEHLFNGIEARRKAAIEKGEPPPEFKVLAQFMEIYYEEILDLLDTTRDASDKKGKSHIKIHEDASGSIYTVGVTTRQVTSLQETMQCLKNGALSRTTASTNMNAESSRSHAIFTLHIKQQRVVLDAMPDDGKEQDTTEMFTDFETLTAKFHFVDLAGSERLKRTGATGNRAKEGISINCGLLALGNVISALGDKAKKGSHVPYRDSKLTRLLQDSLGGNSRTVMIACVSPSDRDFMETLNTLKYANRARNIKNKVCINQDKTSRQMTALRAEILDLQQELVLYKTGKHMVDADGVESINDMFHENTMLQTENNNLRMRVKALQQTVDAITAKNIALLAEHNTAMIASGDGTDENADQVKALIEGYMKETEELRAKLLESEAMCRVSYRCESVLSSVRDSHSQMSFTSIADSNVSEVLALAKREVKILKKKTHKQRDEKTERETLSEDEKQEHEAAEGEELVEGEEEKEEESDEETEENEGSDEEDLELEMSSNSESEEEAENLHEDLADLTCEISIKQKLIEQLELSQRKLAGLRSQYEGKLLALTTRIKDTEVERDKVLSNLGEYESHSQDAAKRIHEQYEKKLNDMQNELKKLNAAKREHAKLLRNQQQYEKQLKMMQTDLKEMKKLKVKLMNQIKDESMKVRRVEQRRSKEVAQFRKEQRQKDNQIRSLEAETKKKDVVIRRKQEEMALLRRLQQQRPMSSKVAGRVGWYDRPVTVPKNPVGVRKKKRKFSAKAAKSKWDALEKCVSQIIIKRQTLSHMERDMERWLKQRASLSKKLEKFMRKKEKAVSENKEEDLVQELEEQISGLQDNIAYVQENISDCQSNIMQMEESKDVDQEPVVTFNSCDSLEEAKYLLEHFVTMSISKGVLAAQKESESKELVAKLHQERMDGTFQRDMLQYLIRDKVDIDIDDSLLMQHNDSDSDSDTSSCSASLIESALESPSCVPHPLGNAVMLSSTPTTALPGALGSLDSVSTSTSSLPGRKDKARRKTATPEDLLYAGRAEPALPTHPLVKSTESAAKVNGTTVAITTPSPTTITNSFLMPPPRTVPARPRVAIPTAHARVENGATRHDSTPSPSMPYKAFTKSSCAPDMSPSMRRKTPASSTAATTSSSGSLSRHSSTNDVVESTPPCSPMSIRRSRPDNVFSRLTSQANPLSPHPSRGVISQVPNRAPPGVMPLIHTHSALGHSKAVLSVFATEDLLFSSSKDRTCKIWDLHTGEEILTLTGHPNNVVAVRYSEETSLVYTVSTYFIKVWDVRQGNKCIKTLTSSGFTNDGVLAMKSTTRQVTCPPGETNITDVVVNSTGTVLYSAAGNTVRIWDLRSFKAVGKLSGGHQAAVMVLAVDDTDTADGNICVVTGSKDHYIKVFEVSEDSVGVMCPKYNLEPPHYDGIQSLCLMGDLLFSGSRDTCIKKWDLSEQQLKQSINNSHKDWICGLAFMPGGNCLLSGCRGGLLKLWNIDTCNMLGEIRAHDSPINSITTNSSLIFTASNDTDIHIWQPQWDQLPSSVMHDDEIFI